MLELIVTLVIASLPITLSVPAYDAYVGKARVAQAIADIAAFDIQIPSDPWGRAYQYLNIIGAGPGKGDYRKDGKLSPLNTDHDLYSMGADGDSKGPLSAAASRDDIVRANNGAHIGLGEDY